MTLNIDENGTIFIHQGDSGEVVISGLDTTKNYSVYFAVKNNKRETVGDELCVSSNYQPSVTFFLSADFTDLFTVPPEEDSAIYYYGIKLCEGDSVEDTLFIANSGYGQMNYIIVFPKIVEGRNE